MSETAPAARADWPAFENLPGRQLICDSPLLLECGRALPRPVLAYQTYGELNGDKSNAVLVCHALTGDQFPVERHPVTGKPGWWEMLIGPGLPIDTDRYFILCVNVIGGCMGSNIAYCDARLLHSCGSICSNCLHYKVSVTHAPVSDMH